MSAGPIRRGRESNEWVSPLYPFTITNIDILRKHISFVKKTMKSVWDKLPLKLLIKEITVNSFLLLID